MRAYLALAAVCGLAACQTTSPNSYQAPASFNAPVGVATSTIDGGYMSTAGTAVSTVNGGAVPGGISNDTFAALSSNVSIADDAARIAQNRANYQVIQPTALPMPSDTGPNIVQYALNAPNAKGQEWYSRFRFASKTRFERNCLSYRSADEAQRDFLARGGPDRDPRGLDPDGDGFACGWDPAPFRAAARG